jgi:hypothetical protein
MNILIHILVDAFLSMQHSGNLVTIVLFLNLFINNVVPCITIFQTFEPQFDVNNERIYCHKSESFGQQQWTVVVRKFKLEV